jgi:uncharacterized membrane protein
MKYSYELQFLRRDTIVEAKEYRVFKGFLKIIWSIKSYAFYIANVVFQFLNFSMNIFESFISETNTNKLYTETQHECRSNFPLFETTKQLSFILSGVAMTLSFSKPL